MFTLLLLAVLVISEFNLEAPELLSVQNFSPAIYPADHQNWMSPQSEKGNICLGNNIGYLDHEIQWTPSKIQLAVDSNIYQKPLNSARLPFESDFSLIVSIAMDENVDGAIDSNFNESTPEINYSQVYQKN